MGSLDCISTKKKVIEGNDMDFIKESLDKLIRGNPSKLDAYFLEVCKNEYIDSTKAEMHIYMLRLDGNNRPRIKDLASFLSYCIIDYCIPPKDIANAKKMDETYNTTQYTMKLKTYLLLIALLCTVSLHAFERVPVWSKGKMPHRQSHQIAAMTDEAGKEGFNADKHRIAYLEWGEKPAKEVDNDACMILISGGGYFNCCDVGLIKMWREKLTELGFQTVSDSKVLGFLGLRSWTTAHDRYYFTGPRRPGRLGRGNRTCKGDNPQDRRGVLRRTATPRLLHEGIS